MGALEATFQVLTVISSIFVRVAPWPDFRRVYKAKTTGEVQILPVVMLFTNCVVLVWYGYLSENIFPLVVTAVMGLVTCAGFVAVFYRFTDDKRSVHRICITSVVVIVLVCIYGAIGVAGVTGQSKSSMATAMGAISIGTSIGLYGSPLATIRRVVRQKSTASMPFTLCLANFLNSVCWVVYAILIVDVWVLLPNAFGCVLTTIQLVLYVIYPASKATETQLQAVMIDHAGALTDYEREASLSIVVDTHPQEGDRLARKSNLSRKDSLDFVAIRSPVTQQWPAVSRQ
jgi:solute carrier family 50 protein (sugar transporter)